MGDMNDDPRMKLSLKIYGYMEGCLTTNLIVLGEKLGLYITLAKLGHTTPANLAKELDLNERYLAEWCRQQASAGIISTNDTATEFWLEPHQEEVLTKETGPDASPFFAIGGFESIPALNKMAAEKLPTMYKTGDGLEYDDYQEPIACGTCRELGVWLRHALVDSLKTVPGLAEKLESGISVADVGCGCGEAVLTAAAAFPNSTFHGYDISEEALKHARRLQNERGLTNVEFRNPGVDEESMPENFYELCMTHDAIHDMAHPQQVMGNVRKSVKSDGVGWIIGDMSSLDSHGENVKNHPMASFMYGFSCHLCLPSAMSAAKPAGLGTLGISTEIMKMMSEKAGFGSCEVLDTWEHPLNRYYLLKV